MNILSFGAGVNSTAILALIKLGKLPEMEIVFADTGSENPDTYCHLERMKNEFNITILRRPKSLYDHCLEKRIIPSRMFRWCTDKWKIRPIYKWVNNRSYKMAIGFAKGEERRVKNRHEAYYPLIDLGLTRRDCISIIKRVGWIVPPKSGCIFCPFQKKNEWLAMRENAPELFEKCVRLEENCQRRDLFLCGDHPLTELDRTQQRLSPFESYQHCLCNT